MTTPHHIVNPAALAPAIGFAHAVVAQPGRVLYLGGQTAHDAQGVVQGEDLVTQFDHAAANVVIALREAAARPEHLVSMQVFTTDLAAYRANLNPLGACWRRHFGRHYPAMALFGVTELFDPAAVVELLGVAALPDQG
jgi:enamine deaminase RidA (YjgF/YER057c/UK114 family)